MSLILRRGFPGGSDGKESACTAGDSGSIPGLGRSPGEGNGYPLQYCCPKNPEDIPGGLQSMGLQRVGHGEDADMQTGWFHQITVNRKIGIYSKSLLFYIYPVDSGFHRSEKITTYRYSSTSVKAPEKVAFKRSLPWTSLVAQMVKSLPTMWETRVQSLDQENSWRRKWQPTPVLLPGKSHGWRNLVGYSPWGCKESDTTE